MKVFVTGGSGLVGSHVAEQLMRAGHGVRALVRSGSDTRHLSALGAELWEGSVTHPASLEGALSGCGAVVHAAAVVTARATWEEYRRVNVEGTENVLAAAVGQGVGRGVYVSSVAVYGGQVAGRRDVGEEAPVDGPLPPGELYGRSKREAEAVAWRFHREGLLEVTVVRPDVIYGERDRVVIPLFARYVKSPVVLTVGRGDRALPLVYAGNVAQGIVTALTSPQAGGRVYNLATDYPITQLRFFGLIAEHLGRRPVLLPLPYRLAATAAWGIEALARVTGGRRPVVSRRHIAFMGLGNPFSSRRAQEELGWRPEVPHEEGVRRSVEWWRAMAGRSEPRGRRARP